MHIFKERERGYFDCCRDEIYDVRRERERYIDRGTASRGAILGLLEREREMRESEILTFLLLLS